MSQQEYFGLGTIRQIRPILEQERPKGIFIVRGRTSYQLSGAEQKLGPLLEGYPVTPFMDFSPNAKVEDIEKGIILFKERHCDFIIAIGGGSALDLAKAIALLANHPEKAKDCLLERTPLLRRTIHLLAIPTTAGTGSEATHFAAIYVDKTKYSLAHPSLVPDYAIIDPSLTFSLPPYQTACTGMDALSQAIESYWSVRSTEQSKQYAKEAIALALTHLENAVLNPDPQARIGMAKAANLAGKAINISFTTACHAVSYPLTSYFGVPHGHAVALTLPEMVVHNAGAAEEDCLDRRGIEYVREIMKDLSCFFGVDSLKEVKKRLERLIDKVGLERKLIKIKAGSKDAIKIIVENGFNPERVANNPRQLTEESLRRILERIR